METLAPPVVAVIVTCDPGPWFSETLGALAAQEYPELSVLVLDAGSEEDPTALVASVLPGAFVRLLGANRGFGASANEVLTMVEGASHYLFCHDDIAPAPDAINLLVEESFRSNAGVVGPKLVAWDDPERLLHVGMSVDKGGAVVDRVDPGEIDHGQHDAVRDVFLVPGGCTLVRADLFAELGGFDPNIFVLGEDLDLCWRAQVAGARVMVAPQARVRHLEMLASGRRHLPDAVLVDIPRVPDATRIALQSLQRRHELHAVLKSYGRFHLLRVLPQLIVLASAECVIGRASGHRDRAAAVVHAWRWNLVRRHALRSERAEVRAHRLLDDKEVRRLQLHGSARFNAYVRRAVTQGLRAAHIGADSDTEDDATVPAVARRRGETDALARRIVVWAVAVLVLVFGTRQLLGSGFPYVGQFLPFPSAGELLHRFFSGWQPSGVGTTDPTSPATGILGAAGVVLFGGVGVLQKLVVLGCIPAGAIGMSRLLRVVGSRRARLTSTLVYLALPLAYNALATGRWDGLLAYAACPWIVGCLARASGLAPFGVADVGDDEGAPVVVATPGNGQVDAGTGDASAGDADPADAHAGRPAPIAPQWRRSVVGRALGLGVLDALLTMAAPSGAVVVLMIAGGLAIGSVVTAGRSGLRPAGRMVTVAIGATVVAFVLLAPWSTAVLAGPGRWQVLTGLAISPSTAPGWGAVLRFSVGPIGDTPLAWAFLASAALPLVIGARWRLAWAGRAWVLALVAWVLAFGSGRGWLGPLEVPAQVLLAPAAVAVAFAVGLGMASFESDLPAYRFGWRQAATALAALAACVGVVPVLLASTGGRWDLPLSGYGEATAWMGAQRHRGDFRVLWLGDPRVLPGGGWQLAQGLGYSISEDGLGDVTEVWSGSAPGAASGIGRGVDLARRGETVRLGRLLAPYAIRYVVVVDTLGPSVPGLQSPVGYGAPDDVEPALLSQLDLRQIISQGGFDVFVDDAALAERAVLAKGKRPAAPPASLTGLDPALSGWSPALSAPPGATKVTGRVGAGTVLAAVAPAASWQLVEPGGRVRRGETEFGYAASFPVARSGTVTVRFRGSWVHGLEIAGEVLLWLVVLCVLAGRRWVLDWWWGRLRRRSSRRSRHAASGRDPEPLPAGDGHALDEEPVDVVVSGSEVMS
jgi:GT2 family glycosyltransferase